MLLKYIVKNYKSIAHSIEYSMFPTEDNLESKYFIPLPTVQGTWKILRRGALLGPNASGKSNFIQSLDFARDYIVEAQKSGNKTGVPQFKGEFSSTYSQILGKIVRSNLCSVKMKIFLNMDFR